MHKNNNKKGFNPKKRQRVDFVEKSQVGGSEVYLGSYAKGEFISDTKYCQAQVRSPKVQSPNVKTKGLTLKSHGPPPHHKAACTSPHGRLHTTHP